MVGECIKYALVRNIVKCFLESRNMTPVSILVSRQSAQMFDNEPCGEVHRLRRNHHTAVLPPNTLKSARSRGQYCQRAPGLAEPPQRVSYIISTFTFLSALDPRREH